MVKAANDETANQSIQVETLKEAAPFASTTTDEKSNREANKLPTKSIADKKLPGKTIAQQAWAIQLGSFRHQKNVQDLVNKLKRNGYTAFTRPIKTKSGTLTKVFVGPELSKKALEKKLPKLKELTKVQGENSSIFPDKIIKK